MLDVAGHRSHARSLWHNLVGRDVLEGRWTVQVVEGFDKRLPQDGPSPRGTRSSTSWPMVTVTSTRKNCAAGAATSDLRSSTRTGDSQPIGAPR